ncbi:MAG: SRPBCC family protein [Bacteroidota bacterium]|nr:SRPBCC family protein [Bacteroidota bacterium]MEC8637874.1 SRPBCC family protein [Bacteroidota bacterium]
MEINSPTATVDQSTEMLFSKLSQVDAYQQLMPEGAEFTAINDNQFRFKLGGMPEIGLTISEKQPSESIVLKSSSNKISFLIRGQLTEVSADQTDVQLHFEGDFNPMMAMMVKKPLTQFMESLVSNMHKL